MVVLIGLPSGQVVIDVTVSSKAERVVSVNYHYRAPVETAELIATKLEDRAQVQSALESTLATSSPFVSSTSILSREFVTIPPQVESDPKSGSNTLIIAAAGAGGAALVILLVIVTVVRSNKSTSRSAVVKTRIQVIEKFGRRFEDTQGSQVVPSRVRHKDSFSQHQVGADGMSKDFYTTELADLYLPTRNIDDEDAFANDEFATARTYRNNL